MTTDQDARVRESDRLTVIGRAESGRYELVLDGEVVGHANHSIVNDTVVITHVETRPDHRGKDFAARLMAGILDDVRGKDRMVRPLCGYAATHMRRHPEAYDLLEPRPSKGD